MLKNLLSGRLGIKAKMLICKNAEHNPVSSFSVFRSLFYVSTSGFTLAEVLITLGIIGVVASMTIPILMNNIQEQQYKTAYKKAYSTISQAFQKAQGDNAIVSLTGTTSSQGGEANFATIKQYFSIAKDCDINSLSQCWDSSGELWKNETAGTQVPSFIDKSGMAWRLRFPDSGYLTPIIFVDTNGSKKPNQYGKDRFPLLYANTVPIFGIDNGGIPTKIAPLYDITGTDANSLLYCPSSATHPCYYTSWLYN